MTEQSSFGYDGDDLFGVRRALEVLPVAAWEQFLFEWRSLTELADFDVHALDVVVRRQARRRARYEGTDDPFAEAWHIVADATAQYLAWRDSRPSRDDADDSSPPGGLPVSRSA